MSVLQPFIARLADGRVLTRSEARDAFRAIMSGDAGEIEMAAFLMALRLRGETVDEIAGGADVLRSKASMLEAPDGAVDTCGTGGDGLGTYNISTAAAIVTAACGVPVAKHGNKAVSSKSGSADVLAQLGVALDIPLERTQACLDRLGICFLLAPKHHGAMRHVAPVRKAMGIRTIFNVLGPLSNPAGAKRQLIGVFSADWLLPLAETLKALGSQRVWVVHGSDGLDELTVTGPSRVAALEDGAVTSFEVMPRDAGLNEHGLEGLIGGTAEDNAAALQAVLDGEAGAYRDVVLLNTAAALLVAGKVADLTAGAERAAAAIDSGGAADLLKRWADLSRGEDANVRHAG